MSSFKQDLLSVLKSKVTIILCGVVTSVITARYLGAEGSGELALLIIMPELLMVVGSMGIRQSSAFLIGSGRHSDEAVFSNVVSLWLFTTLLCVVACYCFLRFAVQSNFTDKTIFYALIPIPFALLGTYSAGLFLGKNKIKEFNSVSWIPEVVRLIGYVALIMLIPLGVEGALLGRALSYMLMLYFVWGHLSKLVKVRIGIDPTILKGLVSLGAIYALSMIVISFNYKVDIILLERWANAYEVGIYTKGASIVEKLWQIPSLLGAIVFARSAMAKDSKLFSYKVAQLLRICFVAISLAGLIFYILSELMMTVLYGEEFLPSAVVQKILLPGVLFMTIFKVLNMDLAGRGKPWIAMCAMIPALVINIGLNWLWIEELGAVGAAWASMVSYTVSALLFLILYSREVNIPVIKLFACSRSDFEPIWALFLNRKK